LTDRHVKQFRILFHFDFHISLFGLSGTENMPLVACWASAIEVSYRCPWLAAICGFGFKRADFARRPANKSCHRPVRHESRVARCKREPAARRYQRAVMWSPGFFGFARNNGRGELWRW